MARTTSVEASWGHLGRGVVGDITFAPNTPTPWVHPHTTITTRLGTFFHRRRWTNCTQGTRKTSSLAGQKKICPHQEDTEALRRQMTLTLEFPQRLEVVECQTGSLACKIIRRGHRLIVLLVVLLLEGLLLGRGSAVRRRAIAKSGPPEGERECRDCWSCTERWIRGRPLPDRTMTSTDLWTGVPPGYRISSRRAKIACVNPISGRMKRVRYRVAKAPSQISIEDARFLQRPQNIACTNTAPDTTFGGTKNLREEWTRTSLKIPCTTSNDAVDRLGLLVLEWLRQQRLQTITIIVIWLTWPITAVHPPLDITLYPLRPVTRWATLPPTRLGTEEWWDIPRTPLITGCHQLPRNSGKSDTRPPSLSKTKLIGRWLNLLCICMRENDDQIFFLESISG